MMLLSQSLVTLALLTAAGVSKLTFINPSPAGANGDYSADPVYKDGSTVTVSWSGSVTGVPLTLALFQQQLEDISGDSSQEVIVDDSVAGLSQYVWTISTSKDLSVSNVFFLDLFSNQSTTPDSTSHYFNITSDTSSTTTALTSTTSVATTSPSAAILTTSSSLSSASSAPVSSASASLTPSPAPSGGLSADAKIGIGLGIAIPLVLALGAMVGWFLHKRRTKPIALTSGPQPPHYELEPKPNNISFGNSQYTTYPVEMDSGGTAVQNRAHTYEMPTQYT